jgi:hypothetical protein
MFFRFFLYLQIIQRAAGFLEVFFGDVQIDLSGLDGVVTQHFAHQIKVASGHHQVCGKGMSKGIGCRGFYLFGHL